MIGSEQSDVLRPALLADFEAHHQNQAREAFKKLERIITTMIIPGLGQQHPISKELYAQLENVKLGSQNFCWKHRHLGYSYSANSVG
ncbi:hypothetical protein V0R50_13095 [Pseudomonas sp. 148P]|uniref:Uncharacterized protein n=1 Tax=Pseudomonas ulcerans TaxID=3115852 RepID=A0ABU7HRK2_9PSED|nr:MULTISPECIES: hypothetical protein [unclassified Pseudomonas]MEE1923201.1 hypothetical protein [Pseudomonas sp. 147P]MEE1934163.1 hypothetical protein [Pseudomonas sp. 148P]